MNLPGSLLRSLGAFRRLERKLSIPKHRLDFVVPEKVSQVSGHNQCCTADVGYTVAPTQQRRVRAAGKRRQTGIRRQLDADSGHNLLHLDDGNPFAMPFAYPFVCPYGLRRGSVYLSCCCKLLSHNDSGCRGFPSLRSSNPRPSFCLFDPHVAFCSVTCHSRTLRLGSRKRPGLQPQHPVLTRPSRPGSLRLALPGQ